MVLFISAKWKVLFFWFSRIPQVPSGLLAIDIGRLMGDTFDVQHFVAHKNYFLAWQI